MLGWIRKSAAPRAEPPTGLAALITSGTRAPIKKLRLQCNGPRAPWQGGGFASSRVSLFHNNKLVAALIRQSLTEDEGKGEPEFVLAE